MNIIIGYTRQACTVKAKELKFNIDDCRIITRFDDIKGMVINNDDKIFIAWDFYKFPIDELTDIEVYLRSQKVTRKKG